MSYGYILPSLRATAKNLLKRVGVRRWDGGDAPDLDLEASSVEDVGSLIRDLGLVEDHRPISERPGWRVPRRVIVLNATERRIEWLGRVVPSVELLASNDTSAAAELVSEADGVIGWYAPELIARAPRLRWLQITAAGVDNLAAASDLQQRQILVTNMQKVAAPAIAEHAIALMLGVSRAFGHHMSAQRARRWNPDRPSLRELHVIGGRTVLIVGMGGIGSRIARLAHGLGMRVHGIRARPLPLPDWIAGRGDLRQLGDMVAVADVVINALPLTEETRNVFDERTFRRMKRTAIFINVGRGATVDTEALTACLSTGAIFAAGLDVVDPEPLPRGHPLWHLPNVLITPHVAGRSLATLQYEWLVKRENLRRFAAGERMLCVVDLARGY